MIVISAFKARQNFGLHYHVLCLVKSVDTGHCVFVASHSPIEIQQNMKLQSHMKEFDKSVTYLYLADV